MTFLKQSIIPTLIILATSAVIVLAALPLAQTEWAEGVRVEAHDHEESHSEDGEPDLGVAIYILPLFKVGMLMGIGGLLTTVAWGSINFVSKRIGSREQE